MTVMNMGNAWNWANGFPQSPPANDCAVCHDCNPLYEEVARRVILALQLPLGDDVQSEMSSEYPGINFINPLPLREVRRLQAQVERIKRISGLYAASFNRLVQLGVPIPFVGAAAFASNVVRWEVEDMVDNVTQLTHDMERRRQRSDLNFLLTAYKSTLRHVINGNAVVFVEIFAIFDFCIRHFREHGVPRTEDDLAEFEDCLEAFITWWDQVQPGLRSGPMQDIRVDRERRILRGIMDSLRATTPQQRRDASTQQILYNEQMYTLQDYMYNIIDMGPIDPMEVGLVMRGYRAAAKFSYDMDAQVPESFIVPYDRSGWLTEAGDRYPYTIEVVSRFDELYFGDDSARRSLYAAHGRMASDARGY